MPVGFKGFAKPRALTADLSKGMLENVSGDEFILFTGGAYSRRRASGRSACLNTVTEKGKPLALADYVARCFKAGPDGKNGFGTDIAIGGLSLHQGAKPAVYLYLVRDAEGNFRAKKDIPTPDPTFLKGPIKAGDVVVAAAAKKASAPVAAKSKK